MMMMTLYYYRDLTWLYCVYVFLRRFVFIFIIIADTENISINDKTQTQLEIVAEWIAFIRARV